MSKQTWWTKCLCLSSKGETKTDMRNYIRIDRHDGYVRHIYGVCFRGS